MYYSFINTMSVKKRKNVSFLLLARSILIIVIIGAVFYISIDAVINKTNIGTGEFEQNKAEVEDTVTTIIRDFPSTAEGTFYGQVQPLYFKESMDHIVVLFASQRITGLALIYYPYQKRLVGGTPQMVAENINLFDGVAHDIIYSFKERGKQMMLYDNQIVAASDFTLNTPNSLTGMVVGPASAVLSRSVTNVEIFEEATDKITIG